MRSFLGVNRNAPIAAMLGDGLASYADYYTDVMC